MNKAAVITGGSDGIGKALAIRLASSGFNVITIGRDEKKLKELDKYNISYLVGDITNDDIFQNFISLVRSKTNSVDLLVNNAGVQIGNALLVEASYSDIEQMLDIHVKVPLKLVQELKADLKKSPSPQIFNIVSVVVKNYLKETYGPYTISKYAEYGLGNMLVKELAKEDIRVTNVILGGANTSIREMERPEYLNPDDVSIVLEKLTQTPVNVFMPELFMSPKVQL
ncbi:SDR family oxidoreductase [Candidatus Dojkabacteria bacterium]|nr:SDR family oxidoreductase [Candidatus Dojkabacteria bacterium]